MHIYFIGQTGIEGRTAILAQKALREGHRVTVATATPEKHPLSMEGLEMASFSFVRQIKWLYIALSCVYSVILHPNTIHVQGWKAALLLRLLTPFLPHTLVVWTITSIPRLEPLQYAFLKRLMPFLASGFDKICTPSRITQYHLLTRYGVEAFYIPDGYTAPSLPNIRPATFGLRKEQYGVLFAQNEEQATYIAKLYKGLKTKKKLVIFAQYAPTGITAIDLPLFSRGAQSLIRQAGYVISTNPAYTPLLLHAMDTGRNIYAAPYPAHEELLGSTATYFNPNNEESLQYMLKEAVQAPQTISAAQIRAKSLFTWERASHEYMRLYRHSEPQLVPFDSIIPKNSFQRAI